MKVVLKILGAVIGVFILLIVIQAVASESGEVVVVQTQDAAGEVSQTRLWVVEHDGSIWLRSGSPEAGWYKRIQGNNNIVVTRGESTAKYAVTAVPGMQTTINTLMNEKYGWADDVIDTMFGVADAVALRLDPQ